MESQPLVPTIVYTQSTQPTDLTVGKLWVNTNNNLLYVSNGSSYISVTASVSLTSSQADIIQQAINILRADNTLPLNSYNYIDYDVFNTPTGILSKINTGSTTAFYDATNKIYNNLNFNPNKSGFVPNNFQSSTTKAGVKFVPNSNITVVGIEKNNLSTATTGYILDSSKTVLTSGSFVGNTCTFSPSVNLTSGVSYYAVVDNGASSYNDEYQTGITYPINTTNLSYTAGLTPAGADNTSILFEISTIYVTNINVNEYIITNSKTILTGAISHMLMVHDTVAGSGSITYDVSLDGGSTWDSTGNLTGVKNLFVGTGTSLVFKINLNGIGSGNTASCNDYGAVITY